MLADIIIITVVIVTSAVVILNDGCQDLLQGLVHSRCSGIFVEPVYTDIGRKWSEWSGLGNQLGTGLF